MISLSLSFVSGMAIIVSVECQAHWKPQLFVPPAKTFQIDLLRPIIYYGQQY